MTWHGQNDLKSRVHCVCKLSPLKAWFTQTTSTYREKENVISFYFYLYVVHDVILLMVTLQAQLPFYVEKTSCRYVVRRV